MSIKFNQCHSRHSPKCSVYASPWNSHPERKSSKHSPAMFKHVFLSREQTLTCSSCSMKKVEQIHQVRKKQGFDRSQTVFGPHEGSSWSGRRFFMGPGPWHFIHFMTLLVNMAHLENIGKHWKTTTQAYQIRSMIAARVIGLVLSKFRVESAIVIWSRPSGQDLSRSNLENGLTSSEKRKCMFNAPSRFHWAIRWSCKD